jgi:O-antigen/teichoic acid export membrane protein
MGLLRCICFSLIFTGTYYIFYSFLISKRNERGTFLIFLTSGLIFIFFSLLGGNQLTLNDFNLIATLIWTSISLIFLILGDIFKENEKTRAEALALIRG